MEFTRTISFFLSCSDLCLPTYRKCRGFRCTWSYWITQSGGRTPLDKGSARGRDFYLTTHEHPQERDSYDPGVIRTHNLSRPATLDRAATATGGGEFPFTCSCIAEDSLCLLSAGAYSRNGKDFNVWMVQVKVHTRQENIWTIDTICHLFISDSKYMECSVTCGFISRYSEVHGSDVLWKVHTYKYIADVADTTPRVSISECQCCKRANYSKLSSQPSLEALVKFICPTPWRHKADVGGRWSKPTYGRILSTGLQIFAVLM